MTQIGYSLSCEEHAPNELVGYARRAFTRCPKRRRRSSWPPPARATPQWPGGSAMG